MKENLVNKNCEFVNEVKHALPSVANLLPKQKFNETIREYEHRCLSK